MGRGSSPGHVLHPFLLALYTNLATDEAKLGVYCARTRGGGTPELVQAVHPLSRANLLVLLFLFLRGLLLYFPLLLGLLRALRYLPPIVLTMLQLRFLLPKIASIPLTPIHLSSVGLTSIILR